MWRQERHHSRPGGRTLARTLLLGLAAAITVFVVGTIGVLASIKWALAFPAGAAISEAEVPWQPQDVIPSDSPAQGGRQAVQGSEPYWSGENWDGRVQGTDSWNRLYNVTTRYVRQLLPLDQSLIHAQRRGEDPPAGASNMERRRLA